MNDSFFSEPVSNFHTAPDLRSYKRDIWRLCLGLSAFLLAIRLAGTGLSLLLSRFAPALFQQSWLKAAFSPFIIYAVGLPVLMVFIAGVSTRDVSHRQRERSGFFTMAGIFCSGYALTFLTNLLTLKLLELFSTQAETTFENPLNAVLSEITIPMFLYAVILGPLLEELVFRSILLKRVRKFGDGPAIFFTAAAFSLFHMNVFQMFYTFLLGAVFAYAALRYGFRYSCLLHIGINLLGYASAAVLSLENDRLVMAMSYTFLLIVIAGFLNLARKARYLSFQNPGPPLTSGKSIRLMVSCPGFWLLVVMGLALSVMNIL